MGINANHPFEDLDGVKCSVVEKLCSPQRAEFLKKILEFNKYTVIVAKTPPPKVVAKPVVAAVEAAPPPLVENLPPARETFTVGVTDRVFNTTNALFGRSLKTPDGHIVTVAFWNQKETVSNDEIPYYEKR